MTQYEGVDEFPIDLILPDDAIAPTGAQVNPMLEGLADRTQFLFRRVPTIPLLNWHLFITPDTIDAFSPSGARTNWQAAAWSPERQQWLVATATTGGSGDCEMFAVVANGELFTIVDAPIATSDQLEFQKLIPSPLGSNKRVVGFTEQFASSNYKINVFTQDVGGAWTLRSVLGSNTTARKRADGMYTPIVGFVAGVGVNAGQSSVELYSSVDGVAWVSRTAQLPGGITANCPSWCFAASSSLILAIPRGAAQAAYMHSADGITWTAGSLGTLSGTELATAIAYGPAGAIGGSVFVVSIVDGSTGNTRFIRSQDGVSWSAVPQALTLVAVSDMAVLSSAFFAVSEQADTSGTMLYSLDGALTWRRIRYNFPGNLAVGVDRYTRPRIIASDTGLVAINSRMIRFSFEAGLTAQIT